MKKLLVIFSLILFAGQGCVLPGNQGRTCDDINKDVENIDKEIKAQEAKNNTKSEECDTYPKLWSDASAAGESKEELDSIVEDHEACLAELDQMEKDLEGTYEKRAGFVTEQLDMGCEVSETNLKGEI